jgi:hypothetical protein
MTLSQASGMRQIGVRYASGIRQLPERQSQADYVAGAQGRRKADCFKKAKTDLRQAG